MEPPVEILLHGEFGAAGARATRYALTLTRLDLHVQRLVPRPEQERRLVLPLCHVLGCRVARGGRRSPEEEEDQVAHFAVYCYLPKKRLVGAAKGRQRLVKTFQVDGGARRADNQAVAERWSTAIKCLLLGMQLPEEAEITSSLLPRPRRLLLLVNPHSGRSLAMSYCHTHILPMIAEANISYNLICTEYQNHGRKLVQDIKLSEWDGIVIVSGDGLLHEVINGLMDRPDWEKAIQMPVGILPAGSGNALAAAVNHNAGYGMAMGEELLVNCTLLLCRGLATPMDLVSVTTASGERRFSFLSVAWGFVADVDIESEKYRGAGSARFTVGTLVRLASLRRYRGRLSYLPAGARPKRALCRSITTSAEGPLAPLPGHPPLSRTLSDTGLWSRAPDSPSPFLACEGFSFEGPSLPEETDFGAHENGDRPEANFPAREGTGRGSSEADFMREGTGHGGSEADFPTHKGAGHGGSETDCRLGRGLPEDDLLPPLDQPVPPHWQTLDGDFVLVLAMYQTHLGADLMAAPFARFDDRALHLCYVTAGISRAALLRLFLAMEKGTHFALDCPYLACVPALAFRLEPLTPKGIITVDGEQVEYGPLQAQVHGSLSKLITGVPPNTNGV